MRCTVNPVVGHESLEGWAELQPAKEKRKVLVIGGGAGGMEAARVASLRGHEVILYEKEKDLGGQQRISSRAPGKAKLNYIKEYYESQLPLAGVKMELGREVNEKELMDKTMKAEVIILASGAEQARPDIPGISGSNVLMSWDVLAGRVKVTGGKVVVAGGGLTGCETALLLADQGKKVTIVDMLGELAGDMEPITRFDLITERLPAARIESLMERMIMEISDQGVILRDPQGNMSLIEADNVVISLGSRPVKNLEEEARRTGADVYVIGDARKPRQIIDAIFEGASVARLI